MPTLRIILKIDLYVSLCMNNCFQVSELKTNHKKSCAYKRVKEEKEEGKAMRRKIGVACMLLVASLVATTPVAAAQKQTAKVVTVKGNKSVKGNKTITIEKGKTLKLRIKKGSAIKSVKSGDKKIVKITNQGRGKKTFTIKGMKAGKKTKVTVSFKSKKFRDFKFTVRVNKAGSNSNSKNEVTGEAKVVGTINRLPKDVVDLMNFDWAAWDTEPNLQVYYEGCAVECSWATYVTFDRKCTDDLQLPVSMQLKMKGDTSKLLWGVWDTFGSSIDYHDLATRTDFNKAIKNAGQKDDGVSISKTGVLTIDPSYFEQTGSDDRELSASVRYVYGYVDGSNYDQVDSVVFYIKVTRNHTFELKVTPSVCTTDGTVQTYCKHCGLVICTDTYTRDKVNGEPYRKSRDKVSQIYYSFGRQHPGVISKVRADDREFDLTDYLVSAWEAQNGTTVASVCARTPHHYAGQTWTVTK